MKKSLKLALISASIVGAIILVVVLIITQGGKPSSQAGNNQKISQWAHGKFVAMLEDVRFKLVNVRDLGNVLKGKDAPYLRIADLKSSGHFLEVTVSVQNIGTKAQPFWFLSDIVDGEGRDFNTAWKGESWVPQKQKCYGRLSPTSPAKICKKIFELPNDSTGLKLKIEVRNEKGFLDLGI